MVENPIPDLVLITVFLQGFTDGPVRSHLFRIELNSVEEVITTAVQEDFNVRQAHTGVAPYRPARRVEAGGPEPIDLCHAGSESSRVNDYKKSQKCYKCKKTGHYAYECSAPGMVPHTIRNNNRQAAKRGPRRGSNVVAKP